jgi:hypothetical protein
LDHEVIENDVFQLVPLAFTQVGETGAASADRNPAQEFPGDRIRRQNLQGDAPGPLPFFLAEDVHLAGRGLGAEMTVDAPAGYPAQAEVDDFPDVAGMVDQALFFQVDSLVFPALIHVNNYRRNVDQGLRSRLNRTFVSG